MKRILVALMILVIALFLSSCGSTDKGKAARETAAVPATDKITIYWYYFPVFSQDAAQQEDYEQMVAHEFEKANPDIHVALEAIDFASGPVKLQQAMDQHHCNVIFDAPGRIIEYGREGRLERLDDFFDTEYVKDVNNKAIIESCGTDGAKYMYPLSTSPFYMAFNRQMLEEAGVEQLVHEGWTVEDFQTVLTALKAAGFVPGSIFCSGNGGDQATRALVANLYGSAVINDELTAYTINDANGVKALEFIKTAVAQGLLVNGALLNGSDDINKFVSGKASFTILWGNVQQIGNGPQLAARHIDVVAVPFPAPQGQAKLEYLVNGFAVVKNQDATKVAASKKFVRFLCDDERIGRLDVAHTGGIPVRKSFGDTPINGQVRVTAGWTKYYSVYYNTVNGFSDMRNYWHEMLQSLLKGTKSEQKASDDFVKLANESLQGGNK